MTQTLTKNDSQTILNASMAALMLAFAAPGYAADLPASVTGKASDALVTLATTGNPEPLRTELGGTVISSDDLQKKANTLMKLQKMEHLAPKALVTPTGDTYAMVAPTITKDNFILADRQGNVFRVDVGDSEGHRMRLLYWLKECCQTTQALERFPKLQG
ncbi:MAG: hypothetical protein H8K03_21270 [Nitrospira sp.]